MSQAIISNNTTIKISGAVAATVFHNVNATGGSPVTLLTNSANTYLLVQLYAESGSPYNIYINGVKIYGLTGPFLVSSFYVGPSQQITFAASGGGILTATGVQFTNSP